MVSYEAHELKNEMAELRGMVQAILSNTHHTAKKVEKIDDQTTPVIGWGWAAIAGVAINVIWLPIMQHAGIPYITPAVAKLTEIENIITQEIGISVGTITDAATGEGHGVHPQLMAIYRRANELAQQQGFTIHIRDGLRSVAEQAANVRNGNSITMNSRHLKAANGWGHALDLEVLYDGPQSNKKDWEGVNKIKPLMFQAAEDLRIPLEWGGNWKKFVDGFHWQLPWESFPASRAFAASKPDQIPVLTERNISALLVEIKRTESSGGNYQAESKADCMLGAYQAAAITLTQHGYIKPASFTAARKPEKGQPHCDFLNNPDNWTVKGGKQTYLASSAMQDEFARKNIQYNLRRGANEGAIDTTSTQQALMGYSKAAWLKPAAAIGYYTDGTDDTDGNGTAISTYAKEGASVTQESVTQYAGTGNLLTIINRIKGALLN